MSLSMDLEAQLDQLRAMNPGQLQHHWTEVFGRPMRTTNPDHLRHRIARRLQTLALGGLSERALARAAEIAGEAVLNGELPLGSEDRKRRRRRADPRLPGPGTELVRVYRDRTVVVTVLANGFEYEGQRYSSLSAIARAVTGTAWNGLVFFGLAKRGDKPPKRKRRSAARKVQRAA
jgi:hypothetical protein